MVQVSEAQVRSWLSAYRDAGDRRACERILSQFSPLVQRLAQGQERCGATRMDVIAAGQRGLYTAICSFDMARKDVSFLTYAFYKIRAGIKEGLRTYRPITPADGGALNDELAADVVDAVDHMDIDGLWLRDAIARAPLTDVERRILRMVYVEQMSAAEIGRALKMHKSRVHQQKSHALQVLRGVLHDAPV